MITALDEKGIESSPQWEVVPSGIRRAGRASAHWTGMSASARVSENTSLPNDAVTLRIPAFNPFRQVYLGFNQTNFTALDLSWKLRFLLNNEEVYFRQFRHMLSVAYPTPTQQNPQNLAVVPLTQISPLLSQNGTPNFLSASSSNAAAANNQTLSPPTNGWVWVTGFEITGAGATAGSTITVTLTGLLNTQSYRLVIPAGAGVGITPLIVNFNPPLPAAAAGNNIVLNVPSFGAGNTDAAVTLHGYSINPSNGLPQPITQGALQVLYRDTAGSNQSVTINPFKLNITADTAIITLDNWNGSTYAANDDARFFLGIHSEKYVV